MSASPAGIALIKHFEQFSAVPYICAGGKFTNGWGHTKGITKDTPAITLAEGERLLAEDLAAALAQLGERERVVLTLRYGLDGGKPRTLEVVGREFGITRERARQIEAEALRKLEEADAQQTIDVEATETKHAPAANAATEKEAATPESAPADSASSDTGGGASAADAPASSARDDAAPRVSFARSISPPVTERIAPRTPLLIALPALPVAALPAASAIACAASSAP